MTTVRQLAFSGGEIAPALHARVDQTKYATGLATCRNFTIQRSGGARNRSGTQFVLEARYHDKDCVLRPFVFNTTQTYVMEFGDLYVRFYRDGAPILESAFNVSAWAFSAPDNTVTTSAAHGYSTGDCVIIDGTVGTAAFMSKVNGRQFTITVTGATTFTLDDMNGANFNATSGYTSGGTVKRVYTLTTPYVEADLQELQIAQSADVVTIVHPNYAPRKLSRASDTSWTLEQIYFETAMASLPSASGRVPINALTAGGAGANTYIYTVTAIHGTTNEETFMGFGIVETVSSLSAASDYLTMSAATAFVTGEYVRVTSDVVTDVPELLYREFVVRNTGGGGGTQIQLYNLTGGLVDITSTGFTGTVQVQALSRRLTGAAAPTAGAPHQIPYQRLTPAVEYNIYKWDSSAQQFGLIGTQANIADGSATQTFLDTGITPDLLTPPFFKRDPFFGTGNYPSCVNYYQQRQFFANTDNNVETVWGSKTAYYFNFSARVPVLDDDAVTFTILGRDVNEIRHLVDLGTSLIILTSGGEWAVRGDSAGVVVPSSVNARQYGYNGANTVRPCVVGQSVIYAQARGSMIREFGWNFEMDGYRGTDLTVFSSHLFEGYTIRDMAYSYMPDSTIWVVRSDGKLLGLTLIKDHQIAAWHRHDTNGEFKQVTVVPEGSEDVPYFVVKRMQGSTEVRYIERLTTRFVDSATPEDMIFVDAAKTYDGTITSGATVTLTSGGGWTYTDTITATASSATFASTDVGKQIHITGTDGTLVRMNIDGYTSTTVVTGRPEATVPTAMRSTALANWGIAIKDVPGLWHLQSMGVERATNKFYISALGDGAVLANAYTGTSNSSGLVRVDSDGMVSLSTHAVKIHVGLGYLADLETLDIDTTQGETLADKKKLIGLVTLYLEKTRGGFVGNESPGDGEEDGEASQSVTTGLYELKLRDQEGYTIQDLKTGLADIRIESGWTQGGRVFIRQADPLPMSVLSVIPSGFIPFRG